MPETPEVIINDSVIKQIASLAATGTSTAELTRQFGMSKYHVKKIMDTDLFKRTVQEIGDEATRTAKASIRNNTAALASEVTRVLRERLEENDLEAVKVALKVIGFDQVEQTKGDTNLVIQLPGQRTEKSVESEFHVVGSE